MFERPYIKMDIRPSRSQTKTQIIFSGWGGGWRGPITSCCMRHVGTCNTPLLLMLRFATSLGTCNTPVMLRFATFLGNCNTLCNFSWKLQHARDATPCSFSWNSRHALQLLMHMNKHKSKVLRLKRKDI